MSDILFNKNNVIVTTEYIDINGEKIPRGLLWSVQLVKYNEEFRSLLWGIGTLIAGVIMLFSFNWTIIGIIALVLGGILAFFSGRSISKGEIKIGVMLSFALNQDIRDLTHKTIHFENSKDAQELKTLLKT